MSSVNCDIQERASALLQEMFNVSPEQIQENASLSEDLDLDSIDTIDLLSRLNEEFSLELTPFEFQGCNSLGQFLEKLVQCQQALK